MSGTYSAVMAEERLFATVSNGRAMTAGTTTTAQPIAAFEVPNGKRILQIVLATIYCFLSAGVVFGFAALKPVLVREGVYKDRCTEEELRDEMRNGPKVCYQQELALDYMFTVAAVATNVCALLVGTVLDLYGPRVTGVIGAMLFLVGCVGFAFGDRIIVVDAYPLAYLLMSVGGSFVFIPSYHLANAFPRHSGLILSMLTGAFDASSAVFLGYRLLYEMLGGVSLKQWFLGYLVVPVTILVAQVLVMPGQSYQTASELALQAKVQHDLIERDDGFVDDNDEDAAARNSHDDCNDDETAGLPRRLQRRQRENLLSEVESLLGGPEEDRKRAESVDRKRQDCGVWGVMHGKPVSEQLQSFWFWGIAAFTIVQMTRINYFVATIRPQYEFLLHSYRESIRLNSVFDICLPLGGIVAIPLVGHILDSYSTSTVLTVLVTIGTLLGILNTLENSTAAAYLTIILFVVYRPFYYTVVSDYFAKVFGIKTFGKVYGAVTCLAGAVSLVQQWLERVTLVEFMGDPRPVNGGLAVATLVVGVLMVAFVKRTGKCERRRLLECEATLARTESRRLLGNGVPSDEGGDGNATGGGGYMYGGI